MDDYVGEAIQKIKLQEQDNEVKLREKREMNAAVLPLNRAFRDSASQIDKLTKEAESLRASVDKLQQNVIVARIRRGALEDQVGRCYKHVEKFRNMTENGIATVWEKRSKLLEKTQNVSDKCDFWSLLIKPAYKEVFPAIPYSNDNVQVTRNDERLKKAVERKNAAVGQRNFLLSEPDVGEEFVRIKNAIQYSKEITAKVRQP